MKSKPMRNVALKSALKKVKNVSQHVQYCPSCQSDQIYTAINLAYVYNHLTHDVGFRGTINLAEHGWHGCTVCNHKWVSNRMLQTAISPKATPPDNSKVIDLAKSTKKRPGPTL